jgi:hypothetical protein
MTKTLSGFVNSYSIGNHSKEITSCGRRRANFLEEPPILGLDIVDDHAGQHRFGAPGGLLKLVASKRCFHERTETDITLILIRTGASSKKNVIFGQFLHQVGTPFVDGGWGDHSPNVSFDFSGNLCPRSMVCYVVKKVLHHIL